MRTYLIQRLILAVPTVIAVTFLVFGLTQLLPGDPAHYIAGIEARPEDIQRVREEYRLDDPMVVQYASWMGKVVRGDFGRSTKLTGVPISTLLRQRLPATLELAFLAMTLSVLVAVPAGLVSALWRDSPVDLITSALALSGISFPNFVLAYILVFVFAIKLGLLPATGYVPFVDNPGENLQRMILPALSLAGVTMAAQTRMLRTSALEVLSNDFVRTARAKGLSERMVLSRHVLRAALIPFITIAGVQMAHLLSGAVIVESVFALPGIGLLSVESIRSRDFPALQAVVLVSACFYLGVTILLDILYAAADPRIRFSGGR